MWKYILFAKTFSISQRIKQENEVLRTYLKAAQDDVSTLLDEKRTLMDTVKSLQVDITSCPCVQQLALTKSHSTESADSDWAERWQEIVHGLHAMLWWRHFLNIPICASKRLHKPIIASYSFILLKSNAIAAFNAFLWSAQERPRWLKCWCSAKSNFDKYQGPGESLCV